MENISCISGSSNILDEVLHISDAVAMWGKNASTLRRLFKSGDKFKYGIGSGLGSGSGGSA